MSNSELYDHPALYDALFPVRADLRWYLDLARAAAGDVLELACGTGQFTVPIARAGVPIAGLDLSPAMLQAARERAATANISVEFLQGDMRNFEMGRQFKLIFIAHNSLLHLHTAEEIVAAFATVRRHLAPGGVFAFDIFNPSVRRLARPPGQRFRLMQVETQMFGSLSVEEIAEYDAAAQVTHARLYISAPGKPDAWVVPLDLRNIFPQELPLLLAAGGLELKSRAGDLFEPAFHSESRSQVCLCQAP